VAHTPRPKSTTGEVVGVAVPVRHTTTDDGRPAYQWGPTGKKYTYTRGNTQSRNRARNKAIEQGRAARARGGK